jgi:hypothetical protein
MKTKVIQSMKAQITHAELDDLQINFVNPPPEWDRESDSPIDSLKARFSEEAQRLGDALCEHLPGGLVDAILGDLLRRKATVYCVPLYDRDPKITCRDCESVIVAPKPDLTRAFCSDECYDSWCRSENDE